MVFLAQGNQAQVAGGFNWPLENMTEGIMPEPIDFKVHLLRESHANFGITMVKNGLVLRVTSIRDDSEYSVARWNDQNPEHRLQVGHLILEVNGIRGDSSAMMGAIKQCKDIELIVRDVKVMEFLHQMLQYRRLTPLHYELLRALDESTPTKTGITRMNVVQMPRVLASDVGADQCSICFDEYGEDDLVTQLPCKHHFCTKCIERWLTQRSKRCPICKQDAKGDVHELPEESSIDRQFIFQQQFLTVLCMPSIFTACW
jgi:hypothetical protein